MRFLWLLVLLCSCNRTEEPLRSAEPRANRQPEPAPAHTAVSESGAPSTGPSCLVKTPAEAPPVAGPAENCPADPGVPPELPPGGVRFEDAAGSPRVQVEIAREESHRARGLMYRTLLAEGEGMLFSWNNELQRTFWMRNTCIPLDMLFIAADGTILGILEQVPVMNDAPRTIPCPAAHVLEVPAGYTRKHGILAGTRVTFE